jgi:hypothetical protein
MRAGAAFGGLAPTLSARVAQRMGGDKIARDLAAGQADKR